MDQKLDERSICVLCWDKLGRRDNFIIIQQDRTVGTHGGISRATLGRVSDAVGMGQ